MKANILASLSGISLTKGDGSPDNINQIHHAYLAKVSALSLKSVTSGSLSIKQDNFCLLQGVPVCLPRACPRYW